MSSYSPAAFGEGGLQIWWFLKTIEILEMKLWYDAALRKTTSGFQNFLQDGLSVMAGC